MLHAKMSRLGVGKVPREMTKVLSCAPRWTASTHSSLAKNTYHKKTKAVATETQRNKRHLPASLPLMWISPNSVPKVECYSTRTGVLGDDKKRIINR